MIILDNGHGYDTYGKASPLWPDGTQLFEYEFNRDVVKRIHNTLCKLSIKSVILVPEAIDISLSLRVKRANDIYRSFPGSFLISVHGNAGGGNGWEVWTSPGQTESDVIANYIYYAAKKYLSQFKMRHDYLDGDPDKESRFTILTKTICPAVLTENLFFDNWEEYQFMNSNEGREIIANLHVEGVINYIKHLYNEEINK
jgi:N-acetylmuramoyl-L-alanine amidase